MKLLTLASLASALTLPVVALGVQTSHAEDLQFTLNNSSSRPLVEFYVEAASSSTWGESLLVQLVQPGAAGSVTIADGETTCVYDIKGVFADGTSTEQQNLNLCQLGSYTYYDK